MARAEIRVEGMDELRRGLRNIDQNMGKEVGRTNRTVGDQVALLSQTKVAELRGRFPAYDSRYVRIRPSANQRRVIVTIPGAAEHGAHVHPVYGNTQAQSRFRRRVWPAPKRDGYVVRPTVVDNEQLIAGTYIEAIHQLAARAIGD